MRSGDFGLRKGATLHKVRCVVRILDINEVLCRLSLASFGVGEELCAKWRLWFREGGIYYGRVAKFQGQHGGVMYNYTPCAREFGERNRGGGVVVRGYHRCGKLVFSFHVRLTRAFLDEFSRATVSLRPSPIHGEFLFAVPVIHLVRLLVSTR